MVGGISRALSERFSLTLFLSSVLILLEAVRSETTGAEKEVNLTFVFQNRAAIFKCHALKGNTSSVIFSKAGQPFPISLGGELKIITDARYSVTLQGKVATLRITNLRPEDAGEYQCRLTGPGRKVAVTNCHFEGGIVHLKPAKNMVKSRVGETVTLSCVVNGLEAYDLIWKDAQGVLLTYNKLVLVEGRFSVVRAKPHQWGLRIKHLRRSDFGVYTCLVNTSSVEVGRVKLIDEAPNVSAPILIKDVVFMRRVFALTGDSVRLYCSFNASPPANVTWFRRSSRHQPRKEIYRGSPLIFFSLSLLDSGEYLCVASNGIKPDAHVKIELLIQAAPPPLHADLTQHTTHIPKVPDLPEVYLHQTKIGQCMGRHVTIQCTAVGLPRPRLYWTRQGNVLFDGGPYKIKLTVVGDHATHSVLQFRILTSRDFGYYDCTGVNDQGQSNVVQQVYDASTWMQQLTLPEPKPGAYRCREKIPSCVT